MVGSALIMIALGLLLSVSIVGAIMYIKAWLEQRSEAAQVLEHPRDRDD